ncbi:MAG: 16S rRNA (uracil(1498)-N(3))-methyltransferase, partial [Oscillospiraceae bacterium]|nr:16S rRNA (uracil(1498)-N(3))-methyltransferase [Oscillospiraceae bacterium]
MIGLERWRYPRFFTENIAETTAVVSGEDVRHITSVLRMRAGDIAVLCDGHGTDFLAELSDVEENCCEFKVLESSPNLAEPNIRVRLFQAMPKGDKMDFIVQKAVECGACEIVPIFTKRCVSRPDEKALSKKLPRWRKIAAEAAKQCGRGIIPTVGEAADISKLKTLYSPENTGILFYECSETPLKNAVSEFKENVDIVIGSEGGFELSEAEELQKLGFACVSLGKRILRCET